MRTIRSTIHSGLSTVFPGYDPYDPRSSYFYPIDARSNKFLDEILKRELVGRRKEHTKMLTAGPSCSKGG